MKIREETNEVPSADGAVFIGTPNMRRVDQHQAIAHTLVNTRFYLPDEGMRERIPNGD